MWLSCVFSCPVCSLVFACWALSCLALSCSLFCSCLVLSLLPSLDFSFCLSCLVLIFCVVLFLWWLGTRFSQAGFGWRSKLLPTRSTGSILVVAVALASLSVALTYRALASLTFHSSLPCLLAFSSPRVGGRVVSSSLSSSSVSLTFFFVWNLSLPLSQSSFVETSQFHCHAPREHYATACVGQR